ncbi:DegV family protein [Longilinea arvoryzae]|nr:DegV family protein [Longilinea arvoryzae]
MRSACILTDNSAQFPLPAFPGRGLVRILPHDISLHGQIHPTGKDLKLNQYPPTAGPGLNPNLIPPSIADFQEVMANLSQDFDDILVILISSQLSETYQNAVKAAEDTQGRSTITVIDSQTISIGLGILVQTAAGFLEEGRTAVDVEKRIRYMIPHIYTLLCTPGLTYLDHAGFIDPSQATVGELLGLLPIFSLEEGKLSPLEKTRNYRAVLDFFQEFIDEFDQLDYIALLQNGSFSNSDLRQLRQHAEESYSAAQYIEHMLNLPMATLFSPKCVGLFVIEAQNHRDRLE